MISTSIRHVEHPFAGRNTQQTLYFNIPHWTYFWQLKYPLPTTDGLLNLFFICCYQQCYIFYLLAQYIFYPTFSGVASCVGTSGTVMWCLHLTGPCCVALGRVLVWVVSPYWFRRIIISYILTTCRYLNL